MLQLKENQPPTVQPCEQGIIFSHLVSYSQTSGVTQFLMHLQFLVEKDVWQGLIFLLLALNIFLSMKYELPGWAVVLILDSVQKANLEL